MKFTIVIIRPPNYPYSDCFQEIAETVMYGLRSLGHDAEIRENALRRDTTHIVFGAHMLPRNAELPEDSILYNLEQVAGGNIGCLAHLGKTCQMWDYAKPNIEAWKNSRYSKGVEAQWVPLGYVPEMTRIEPQQEDIDVLFYGSLNPRRAAILEELSRSGLRVVARINDAYGETLNSLIARAKVILNVHYYDSKIFEIVRVGYALANKKAVVSEISVDDGWYPFSTVLYRTPYEGLVEACRALVGDAESRKARARTCFEAFSQMKESDFLNAALRNHRTLEPAH